MDLLFVIPHFSTARDGVDHGSASDGREVRAAKLSRVIAGLHDAFPERTVEVAYARRHFHALPVAERFAVRVLVLTTAKDHVAGQLDVHPRLFEHVEVDVDGPMLGFAARRMLAKELGSYDACGYVEDDILVSDPELFDKVRFFTELAGPQCVLMPNRVEVTERDGRGKAFIDGDFVSHHAAQHALPDGPGCPAVLEAVHLGRPVRFVRAVNPHAGAFFLMADQVERWAATPWLEDEDASFNSSLESAATLGLLKAFALYKPDAAGVPFLEVRHLGERFIATVLPTPPGLPPDAPAGVRAGAMAAELRRITQLLEAESAAHADLKILHEHVTGLYEHLDVAHAHVRDLHREVLASTSWRITAPLRWLVGRVRARGGAR